MISTILVLLGVTLVILAIVSKFYNTREPKNKPLATRPTKKDPPGEDDKKEESKKTEEQSLGSLWKSIPEWLQKMISVFVLLFAIYLLFFMAPNKQPVYKQIVEKETVLEKGDVIEFKIAKGDSVHLKSNLPHLVVWQGFNEQHGESRHYSGKDWIEISTSSRVVRISPCNQHDVYGDTLFYTIYRK